MKIELEGTCYSSNGCSPYSAGSDEDMYDESIGEITYDVKDKQVYEAIADYEAKYYSKKFKVDEETVKKILEEFMNDVNYNTEENLQDWEEIVADYYQDKQDELEVW